MKLFAFPAAALLVWTPHVRAADGPAGLDAWAVDPLVKVFRDAKPDPTARAHADVARGEHATLQVVVRCASGLSGLTATVSPLTLEGGAAAVLRARPVQFVGYVPVDRPIQTQPSDSLRKPPADFPDPLLDVETVDVPANQAQPIWITVAVPKDARPGRYVGTVTLQSSEGSARLPVSVHVHDVVIDKTRLWVTNWSPLAWSVASPPSADDEKYWNELRRHAKLMADHRQNVIIISPVSLCAFRARPDGTLGMDFAAFDRAVQLFIDEGVIGRIEGAHLGGRAKGWESPFVIATRVVRDGKVVGETVDPADPRADEFLRQFGPALVRHLKEKGWLDRYMQHIADEPIPTNIATYRAMSALVRKHAPELRIIEACHASDLAGAIDIWVPQLDYFHQDYEHYRKRQKAGDEVWFYTCWKPQGEYANRFIEQPLVKTRILHWINYRYGATGYLHWGYNFYGNLDPFRQTTRSEEGFYLPAGDAWIVYPGPKGPQGSIRFAAMRDGIVDYELLSRLAERDKPAADELAARHVLDFDKYRLNLDDFRATRRELLERLSRR